MIRNLKALGLAGVAVLAMGAFVASAAQAVPQFTVGAYPATIETTGENVGEYFHTEAGRITCKVSHYVGTLTEASSTLSFHPTYTECSAFSGFAAMVVNTEECNYLLHATERRSEEADKYYAHVDLTCPAGQSIKTTAGTCKAEIKAQTGLTRVDITDTTLGQGTNDIVFQFTLMAENEAERDGKHGPIAYTVTQDGFLCPFSGTGAKTGGEFASTGGITAIATAPANSQVSLTVTGS